MNKESNRIAAGLRRSAIAERIRLREEWSALKGTEVATAIKHKQITNVLGKKPRTISNVINTRRTKGNAVKTSPVTSEVLSGVVALVEVGSETRALALRAALTALGATIVPAWSPLVTHMIWTQGGCRATRAKARALASQLVSPLWVEACAAANRRLPEQTFPAAARDSDLPSPRTLRRLLKKAEMENIPLVDLLTNSEEKEQKNNRLRVSSEKESTIETSRDAIDAGTRVNTAPRRALPASMTPPATAAKKSRRKLFTQKLVPEGSSADDDSDVEVAKTADSSWMAMRGRKNLARVERMARRIVQESAPMRYARSVTKFTSSPAPKRSQPWCNLTPRVVLTGMSLSERVVVHNAIRSLNGCVQKQVNRRTTHVLLGSCREDSNVNHCNISGVVNMDATDHVSNTVIPIPDIPKARTTNALEGAARGCVVAYAQWAVDSMAAKKWVHHQSYEVPHLKKLSEKARIERKVLGLTFSNYAYDVFNGMRVKLSSNVEKRDAVVHLLNLCGAMVLDDNGVVQRYSGLTPNRPTQRPQSDELTAEFDLTIGTGHNEVDSKWVFDSVAASRMRTYRRYINSCH